MIALGFVTAAALATVTRWQLGLHLPRPYGTLAVNVAGAFALGLLHGADAPELTVLGVGGLGALTTFSTFAQEVLDIWEDRRDVAIAYGAATLVAGVAAAFSGIVIT